MELAAVLTIWATFSCYLLFPLLGLPPLWHRTAMTLCAAEFLAAATWSYGTETCVQRPCGALPEAARTAATYDIPALAAALVAVAVIRGLRSRPRPAPAPPPAAAGEPHERPHMPRPRRASRRPAAPR
jgi:hypothetical protein